MDHASGRGSLKATALQLEHTHPAPPGSLQSTARRTSPAPPPGLSSEVAHIYMPQLLFTLRTSLHTHLNTHSCLYAAFNTLSRSSSGHRGAFVEDRLVPGHPWHLDVTGEACRTRLAYKESERRFCMTCPGVTLFQCQRQNLGMPYADILSTGSFNADVSHSCITVIFAP